MTLPFNQESWIWYTCAIGIISARLTSRKIHLRSIRSLEIDDWIMGVLVTITYTALIVCSNRYVKAQSNLFEPGFDVSKLSDYDLHRRQYGSKMVVVAEQTQIVVIWACKACLLIMYHRITRTALDVENFAIRMLSFYVALGFVLMEVLYFAVWCRPVSEYWAVPTHNDQCNALTNHRITKAVFNLSSDAVILIIALQMLVRSLLPLKRKLILCGIFSLGIFVIIASVLNSYYSFKDPYRQTWVSWYVRESSTAILVANLPFTWTILRECFGVGDFNEASPPAWAFHSAHTGHTRSSIQSQRTPQIRSVSSYTSPGTPRPRFPGASAGSRGSHCSMKLVDSMSPMSPPRHSSCVAVDTPQGTETDKDLMELQILRHDFASEVLRAADVMNIDLEQGYTNNGHLMPTSPPPCYQPRSSTSRDDIDSYINHRQASSPQAHVTSGPRYSCEASVASADQRHRSSAPSFTSESPLRPSSEAEKGRQI